MDESEVLLNAEQVGRLLGLKPRTVRVKSATDPDFPKACKLSNNPHGQRHSPSRWLLSEVRGYLERLKAAREPQMAKAA